MDEQEKLREHDFSKFHSLKVKLIEDADAVLGNDFPRLMEALPRTYDPSGTQALAANGGPLTYDAPPPPPSRGSIVVSKGGGDENNPWMDDASNPFAAGAGG
jgi:hypothetical protein